MAKTGRPSAYSRALAERICDRLANGETLIAICKDAGYPDRKTIWRWLISESPKFEYFRLIYARAREAQAQVWAEQIIEISDDPRYDWQERQTKSGESFFGPDYEHIQRSRLRVDTRKFLMAKVLPKIYGDKAGEQKQEETKLPEIVFAEVGNEPTSE